ncbi:MAG: glycosyl hydrolase, partial [Ekhidna sp.]|nr:glycosyl hydrolase [Ekhidna sp.]
MKKVLFTLMILGVIALDTEAQRKKKSTPITPAYSSDLYEGMQWRSIGPFRGGRSAAVTGVPGKANLFYMGATGGGVWRTMDAGSTWQNISDGFFGGSIGSVAVSEWDNNVIYVGGGEVTVRGNVSSGWGMWKSVDAGTTWQEIGMKKARHIPRIRIHPK